ncbi:uncharacterized protein LY79DRAFT_276004 [Colletotrichum navitas]|uniref:Uncharacterized protein n=1 Tax=Colletotrichum navitas TaxID=681940 RepID=A0AAD8PV02_9PEZI|nr:uncharacterized protein LY79DRAFT_276004 [Colletotrichum navitas]KAK1585155.1 hypothetical protein LY79DRAFT_276004 [Colletotrichum navitas]
MALTLVPEIRSMRYREGPWSCCDRSVEGEERGDLRRVPAWYFEDIFTSEILNLVSVLAGGGAYLWRDEERPGTCGQLGAPASGGYESRTLQHQSLAHMRMSRTHQGEKGRSSGKIESSLRSGVASGKTCGTGYIDPSARVEPSMLSHLSGDFVHGMWLDRRPLCFVRGIKGLQRPSHQSRLKEGPCTKNAVEAVVPHCASFHLL